MSTKKAVTRKTSKPSEEEVVEKKPIIRKKAPVRKIAKKAVEEPEEIISDVPVKRIQRKKVTEISEEAEEIKPKPKRVAATKTLLDENQDEEVLERASVSPLSQKKHVITDFTNPSSTPIDDDDDEELKPRTGVRKSLPKSTKRSNSRDASVSPAKTSKRTTLISRGRSKTISGKNKKSPSTSRSRSRSSSRKSTKSRSKSPVNEKSIANKRKSLASLDTMTKELVRTPPTPVKMANFITTPTGKTEESTILPSAKLQIETERKSSAEVQHLIKLRNYLRELLYDRLINWIDINRRLENANKTKLLVDTIIDKLIDDESLIVWKKAFTHPSYDPNPGNNYEELELLGDLHLSSSFSKMLYSEFGDDPHEEVKPNQKRTISGMTNAEMSKLKSNILKKDVQGPMGRDLGFADHILRAKNIYLVDGLFEDVLEAFFGALVTVGDDVKDGLGMHLSDLFVKSLFGNKETENIYAGVPKNRKPFFFFAKGETETQDSSYIKDVLFRSLFSVQGDKNSEWPYQEYNKKNPGHDNVLKITVPGSENLKSAVLKATPRMKEVFKMNRWKMPYPPTDRYPYGAIGMYIASQKELDDRNFTNEDVYKEAFRDARTKLAEAGMSKEVTDQIIEKKSREANKYMYSLIAKIKTDLGNQFKDVIVKDFSAKKSTGKKTKDEKNYAILVGVTANGYMQTLSTATQTDFERYQKERQEKGLNNAKFSLALLSVLLYLGAKIDDIDTFGPQKVKRDIFRSDLDDEEIIPMAPTFKSIQIKYEDENEPEEVGEVADEESDGAEEEEDNSE